MLTAMTIASVLIAYVFVAGVVDRALTKLEWKLTMGAETFLAAIWPMAPFMIAMLGILILLEGAVKRIARFGHLAAEAPGRAAARWRRQRLRRGLHDDCMTSWAWMRAGADPMTIPHGPCTRCAPRLERLAASRLPRARVVG